MFKKKTNSYHICNKHNRFLMELPKITQNIEHLKTLYSPKEFRNELLYSIAHAYNHIYLITLYLENDLGGKKIIDALLNAKKLRPQLKITIIVDWHRAQRVRIGELSNYTNIQWYYDIINQYSKNINFLSIYGVPINTNEALGVLHLKGFIIDNKVLYSGANLNNEYLHINNKYRHDRYHIIQNCQLSKIMIEYVDGVLLNSTVVMKFGNTPIFKKNNKSRKNIRLFRKKIRKTCYPYSGKVDFDKLSISPLVGIGKKSILNKTIYHLTASTKYKIILCTPYFNIPNILIHNLICLLRTGKIIEIISGDKVSNDFYNPDQENQPFKFIHTLPYLYEINLRRFCKKLQQYIDNKQLIIRIWKNENNGFHIKGIWVDNEWQLLTGSNLNPRSLRFDLENALLIHDPSHELVHSAIRELKNIRKFTNLLQHYKSLEKISDYPIKVKQFIQKIRKIRFDRLINHIL